jgi:hypothetical protein
MGFVLRVHHQLCQSEKRCELRTFFQTMTLFPHYLAKAAQFLDGIMAACQSLFAVNRRFMPRMPHFPEAGVDWELKFW